MQYNFKEAIEVLERTPAVFQALLSGLSEDSLMNNEGPETFSPYDVVGHLIHGEKADWTDRVKRIQEYGNTKAFDVFDRFAMFNDSKGKSITQLLEEFSDLRRITWNGSGHCN